MSAAILFAVNRKRPQGEAALLATAGELWHAPMGIAAIPLLLLALAGIGYTIHATIAVGRFARAPLPPVSAPEPVSLLKPLHGPEPRLAENLATFLDQEWAAPIELVAGVSDAGDPALAVARNTRPSVSSEVETSVRAERELLGYARTDPSTSLGANGKTLGLLSVHTVADPRTHGANAKVGNILNLLPAASHDLLVLSDSDIAVPRDYMRVVAGALAEPGVGAVTCLYRGRGDAGFWSVLAAAAISYQFAPSVLLARTLGIRQPCLGSTIALRRDTLARIGGFEAMRDILADDAAIGAAVQALGLTVAMPPLVVAHGCVETSLASVWRHELRWAATVRGVDPRAYFGTILTHPLPFALLAVPFAPAPGAAAVALAFVARLWLADRVDRLAGVRTAPRWLLPPRDCLSFVVFLASFFVRSVDWRGARLRMGAAGRIARPQAESPRS